MHPSRLASLLLVGILLVACGGGDSDPTPTTAPATPTTVRATATATETGPEGSPTTADDTEAPDAVSTIAPTATRGPVTTPTPRPTFTPHPEPTPTSNTDAPGDPTGIESILMGLLLTEDDLEEGWVYITSGPTGDAVGGVSFCAAEPFNSQGQKLGGVEAEFDWHPQNGPFLLQAVMAYPEEVAQEAFAYNRSVMQECDSWIEDDGTEISLEFVDAPELGDETMRIRLTFHITEVDTAVADFNFVRTGGFILVTAWLTLDDVDTEQFNTINRTAFDRIEASEYRP